MLNAHKKKQINRARRHRRIRARLKGTADRPRLSVFRSLTALYAQIINDDTGKTLLGAGEKNLKAAGKNKTERALAFGREFAARAKEKGMKKVVFDRGGYSFHGRVKAFAEGAREGGLEF